MTRFSVNVGFLFSELPYLERFAAVRRAGFDAVEFAWPEVARDNLLAAIRDAGVRVVQMNMDAGDLSSGERGWASHPNAVPRWRNAFDEALDLAARLDCRRINVLAGNAPRGSQREDLEACLIHNLHWALPRAAADGRVLLLETLNAIDTPTYLFTDTASTASFVERIQHPALRLQFDTYHVATGGEDPAARLRELGGLIGHVQLADAPGRHQPGTGDVDFAAVFAALAEIAYDGAVGLEYIPRGDSLSSFGWLPARPT